MSIQSNHHCPRKRLTRPATNREETNIKPLVKERAKDKPFVRFVGEEPPIEDSLAPKDYRRFIDTESVCTLIQEAHKNNKSLELVFDGEKLWQVKSSNSHVVLRPEIGIPLETLLGNSESSLKLKLKEKRALAVVLAHALLHYCESPWVSDTWNKEHVNFFATVKGPDLMRPYLVTQFEPSTTNPGDMSGKLYSHPNPALLSLGILLLELYLSKPIESLWEIDDTEDGVEGINTNWITAEKQLEKMGDDLYEGYRDAIQACLKIDYVGAEDSLSLDDEGFRRLVFDRVVIPLEDELKNGFHITPEDLGVL